MNNSVINTLGEIEKSRNEKVILRLMEYYRYRYFDMRLFVFQNGEWRSKQGLTFNNRTYESFLKILIENQELIDLALNAVTPEEFTANLMKTNKASREGRPKKKINIDNEQAKLF